MTLSCKKVKMKRIFFLHQKPFFKYQRPNLSYSDLIIHLPNREKRTNYLPIELYTNFMPSQYFTVIVSVKSFVSFEKSFQALYRK